MKKHFSLVLSIALVSAFSLTSCQKEVLPEAPAPQTGQSTSYPTTFNMHFVLDNLQYADSFSVDVYGEMGAGAIGQHPLVAHGEGSTLDYLGGGSGYSRGFSIRNIPTADFLGSSCGFVEISLSHSGPQFDRVSSTTFTDWGNLGYVTFLDRYVGGGTLVPGVTDYYLFVNPW